MYFLHSAKARKQRFLLQTLDHYKQHQETWAFQKCHALQCPIIELLQVLLISYTWEAVCIEYSTGTNELKEILIQFDHSI